MAGGLVAGNPDTHPGRVNCRGDPKVTDASMHMTELCGTGGGLKLGVQWIAAEA